MRYTQSIGYPIPGSYGTQAFTGTSANVSSTSGGRVLRVKTDESVHIALGNATATTSDPLVESADGWVDFKITPKQGFSVIQNSTGGTLKYYELD